ncbi:MAG: hypothetical protein OEY86_16265 [Nitrospira sp.]|nr:hypothetical protein [Nitrospira sp.]
MTQRVKGMLLTLAAISILFVGLNSVAEAGLFGFGGDSWQEEVLLHDGSKILLDRMVKRGGRHEIGQKPPYKEQRLRFSMPGTTQIITWEDHLSEDLGSANFLPMALDIVDGTPYLVVYPMGCLSYNKWGRPNPPYVVFHYKDNEWTRIPLDQLPASITMLNMLFSEPDVQVERLKTRTITTEMIKGVVQSYKQPEFKTILRVPVKPGTLGSTNCEERVLYKGHWILPNDPIAREFIDRQKK